MDAAELHAENLRLLRELEQAKSRCDSYLAEQEAYRTEQEAYRSMQEAVIAEYSASLDEKKRQVSALERRIMELIRQIRGSRQEVIDPSQLMLFSLDELQEFAAELEQKNAGQESAADEPAASSSESRSPQQNPAGRRPLPAHLPREVKRYELDEADRRCPCCGEVRQAFAVEPSEQLEYVPGYFKVIRHERVKYACKGCQEQVIVAPKDPQPIEKGLPAPGLAAHTTLSKFGDHMPLYRQEDILSRVGWTIRRSTLCGWLFDLASLSGPLVMRMKHLLLQSSVIHTDDTKIKMLQPGCGVCKEAKFWPYLGDWLHPYAVYDFTLDRSRHGPRNFLSDYHGYLQADAYTGYDCIYAPGNVKEVACWVHTRRYWWNAQDLDQDRVNVALSYITQLFQIEDQLRQAYPARNVQGERDFAAIAEARQQHSGPILDRFRRWLDDESGSSRILPKSPLRTAFTYTLNQWEALRRYIEQGYLSMDNNTSERLCKISAIGRKNYLFVGNERAGQAAALHYSMVSSAKANGVDGFGWLRACYEGLPNYRGGEAFRQYEAGEPVTSDELDGYLPDIWLRSHPSHRWELGNVRLKERESADRRKRQKRLSRLKRQ
jgi:transposase